jgi:hypothetical protein
MESGSDLLERTVISSYGSFIADSLVNWTKVYRSFLADLTSTVYSCNYQFFSVISCNNRRSDFQVTSTANFLSNIRLSANPLISLGQSAQR